MKKVINPCKCDVYESSKVNAYAEIIYEDGRLSIHGVIGPMSNGNSRGGAGQCVDSIRSGEPTEDWTKEMLEKFCNIWDEWHLNDMRPYCQHQKELGWREQASEKITLYHYTLTIDASNAKRSAEAEALKALRNGRIFEPTKEQILFASLAYGLDIYEELSGELAQYYQPRKSLYAGDHGFTETQTRGWVRYDDDDKGILCKPCPVCGYKYGTSWIKEEVPQEIIDWLFALPTTKTKPAWV